MTRTQSGAAPVRIPRGYPTAMLFLDESGSRASGNRFFVVGAVKVREPGRLTRAVQTVRDRNQFHGEFKFSEITQGTVCAYYDLVDALADSDALIAATVADRDAYDPFSRKEPWVAQLEVAAQLLIGCINRRELVTVIADTISTPTGIAFDDELRHRVNSHFKATSVVGTVCCDSRTHDGLQLADLVAGAIAFDRRAHAGLSGRSVPSSTSPKAKVVRRLREMAGVSTFEDCRDKRLNILTLAGRQDVRALRAVTSRTPA